MWGSSRRGAGSNEPAELRELKHQLANLTCKCNTCVSNKYPSSPTRTPQNDESVQAEYVLPENPLRDKFLNGNLDIQQVGKSTDIIHNPHQDQLNCLNCYFISDLIRRARKVFKDEESEIRPESTDKSTDRPMLLVDSTTSDTTNRNLKVLCKSTSTFGYSRSSTILSSTVSITCMDTATQYDTDIVDKGKNDRVTFLDYNPCLKRSKDETPTFMLQGSCFCRENIINTIRPPLTRMF